MTAGILALTFIFLYVFLDKVLKTFNLSALDHVGFFCLYAGAWGMFLYSTGYKMLLLQRSGSIDLNYVFHITNPIIPIILLLLAGVFYLLGTIKRTAYSRQHGGTFEESPAFKKAIQVLGIIISCGALFLVYLTNK